MFGRRRRSLALLTAVLIVSTPWNAATLHVTVSGSDASGDGSAAHPYRTITQAYNQAAPLDTILVHPGTYRECVNISGFDGGTFLGNKPVDVVAADFIDHGDNTTTILRWDGTLNWPVVTIGGQASLSGFTITGNRHSRGVTALGYATITHNVIRDNRSLFRGGGLLAVAESSDPPNTGAITIADNRIVLNSAPQGGGLVAYARGESSTLRIERNQIVANVASQDRAAGLQVLAGGGHGGVVDVTITNNVIAENRVDASLLHTVGGVYAYVGSIDSTRLEFSGNTVRDNASAGWVGGMYAVIVHRVAEPDHELVIRDNVFEDNVGEVHGGGVLIDALNRFAGTGGSMALDFSNNLVSGNEVVNGAGGLAVRLDVKAATQRPGAVRIAQNEFTGNVSELGAGGVLLDLVAESDPRPGDVTPAPSYAGIDFVGNLVADNENLSTRAGGVWVRQTPDGEAVTETRLSLNTISGNTAPFGASGISIDLDPGFDSSAANEGFASVRVDNSILAHNDGFGIGGIQPPSSSYGIDIAYSDVFGHPAGDYEGWVGDHDGVAGNISADPGFRDPATGDYRLRGSSPAVDAGNPAIQGAPPADLDGAPRIVDRDGDGIPVVDMGAYELSDSSPPTASIVPLGPQECSAPNGALVPLDGSPSSDPDSTPGTNDDIVSFEWFEDFGLPSSSPLGSGEMLAALFPLGLHDVTLEVTDRSGQTDTGATEIVVQDTTPPEVSVDLLGNILPIHPNRLILNHYTVEIDVFDACDASPESGAVLDYGCGAFDADSGLMIEFKHSTTSCAAEMLDDGTLRIKSDRITLRATATDASGNTATVETSVPAATGATGPALREPDQEPATGRVRLQRVPSRR